jgi:hypothetical protein
MNAKKSMRLRRLAVGLILSGVVMPALLLTPISLTVTGVEAQTCSPAGESRDFGPSRWNYNWIANGVPLSDSCWAHSYRASFVTGTTECGPFTPPTNAWEFYYGGDITQSFTISGVNMHAPVFRLAYEVDFDDPNNSGWNRFTMDVRDQTTGAVLASDNFIGYMGDLFCARREYMWTGDLAGHTLLVRFTGSRAYNNTHIRVRNISLFQTFD